MIKIIKQRKLRILTFMVIGLFISANMYAQDIQAYKIKLRNGSKIWIEGDSTMHAYESKTSIINLNAEIMSKTIPQEAFERMNGRMSGFISEIINNKLYTPRLRKFIVELDVKNFHSPTFGLDSNFYNTLKVKEYPTITYNVIKYSVEPDIKISNRFIILTQGILKIAGKGKMVSLRTVADIGDHSVTFTGKKDLLMSDFDIAPPRLLFVTTDNKVTIKWGLTATVEYASDKVNLASE